MYNFCQDDLLTEDVLLLDTHAEVFVWLGQLTDTNEKQTAFEIGQVTYWFLTSLIMKNGYSIMSSMAIDFHCRST